MKKIVLGGFLAICLAAPTMEAVASDSARCEALAGSWQAEGQKPPLVPISAIDPESAISACRLAAEQEPALQDIRYWLSRAYYASENYQAARRVLEELDANGYLPATSGLASLYVHGLGVEKDIVTALRLYRKAAEAGEPNAQALLGSLYYLGQGVETDLQEALKWFRRSAAQGHPVGQNSLGIFYHKGNVVPKSQARAVELFRKAAEQNLPIAQFNFALMNELGRGTPKNLSTAIVWYRKASHNGNLPAHVNLGATYELRNGAGKSRERALELYRKAAEAGHVPAYYRLGNLMWTWAQEIYEEKAYPAHPQFEKWSKMADDMQVEGRAWLEKGAVSGDAQAQFRLGNIHTIGTDYYWDFDKAVANYAKAARQGHTEAQYMYGYWLREGDTMGNTVDGDVAAATPWFKKAAQAGHVRAKRYLGFAYMSGKGIGRDRAKALALFMEAYEAGDSPSAYAIGYAYENGNGVVKNYASAKAWFEKAAAKGNQAAKDKLASNRYKRLEAQETAIAILGAILKGAAKASRNSGGPPASSNRKWKAEWWCETDFTIDGNPVMCTNRNGYVRYPKSWTDPCSGVQGWCDGYGMGGREGFWK